MRFPKTVDDIQSRFAKGRIRDFLYFANGVKGKLDEMQGDLFPGVGPLTSYERLTEEPATAYESDGNTQTPGTRTTCTYAIFLLHRPGDPSHETLMARTYADGRGVVLLNLELRTRDRDDRPCGDAYASLVYLDSALFEKANRIEYVMGNRADLSLHTKHYAELVELIRKSVDRKNLEEKLCIDFCIPR